MCRIWVPRELWCYVQCDPVNQNSFCPYNDNRRGFNKAKITSILESKSTKAEKLWNAQGNKATATLSMDYTKEFRLISNLITWLKVPEPVQYGSRQGPTNRSRGQNRVQKESDVYLVLSLTSSWENAGITRLNYGCEENLRITSSSLSHIKIVQDNPRLSILKSLRFSKEQEITFMTWGWKKTIS